VFAFPLTECVVFNARLQKGNRVQIPVVVRWRFKLESVQVLKVTVNALGHFGGYETFYAQMDGSGRINIPKLTLALLRKSITEKPDLTGEVLQVRLEPA